MARKHRIEFEGALYHVLARGNQRQRIFRSKEDFERYLVFLSQYKERYHFSLFAYVLMSNHVHMLVETAQVPLSRVLQGLNQSYTIYFNRKHETVGHLFQGRYKAILCDRDKYLLTLIKYIHLNPVRARTVETPSDYPWSSHRVYANSLTENRLVDTHAVLHLFSNHRQTAIKQYLEFMETGPDIERKEIYGTVDQRLLGDEQFVSDVKNKVPAEITGTRRQRQHTLEDIARAIEGIKKVSVAMMRSGVKARKVAESRRLFCRAAKEYAYRNHEIATYLAKDGASITRYLKEEGTSEDLLKKVIDSLRGQSTQISI